MPSSRGQCPVASQLHWSWAAPLGQTPSWCLPPLRGPLALRPLDRNVNFFYHVKKLLKIQVLGPLLKSQTLAPCSGGEEHTAHPHVWAPPSRSPHHPSG